MPRLNYIRFALVVNLNIPVQAGNEDLATKFVLPIVLVAFEPTLIYGILAPMNTPLRQTKLPSDRGVHRARLYLIRLTE
jgi:hypothetical protein